MDNLRTQHVSVTTRPASGSILDLVFSSLGTAIDNLEVKECFGSSDHAIISFSTDFCNSSHSTTSPVVPLYHRAKWNVYKRLLYEMDWSFLTKPVNITQESINKIWKSFLNNIQDAASSAIPAASKRTWDPLNTRCVRTALRRHRRLYNKLNSSCLLVDRLKLSYSYRKLQETLRRAIVTHESFLSTQMKKYKCPRRFWSYVKRKMKSRMQFSAMENSGNILTDANEIANAFNYYFSMNFNLKDYPAYAATSVKCPLASENSISSVVFSEATVHSIVKRLPESSTGDTESLCYMLLKKGGFFLAEKLSYFFNLSMKCGSIPDSWRKIFIRPVYKRGSKHLCENYRPIAITSCVCRVMERVLYKEIMSFVYENPTLLADQHGFLPGKSTETCSIEFFDFVTSNIDKGLCVDAVFLDFAKAFDSVPHSLLFDKLEALGIKDTLLSWIKNYFQRRVQVVCIDNAHSEPRQVKSGVIQGSVLGPLLFLLYIQDMRVSSQHVRILKYADDVKLYSAFYRDGPSQDLASKEIQCALDTICIWSQRNGISLNIDKCKTIHFGKPNRQHLYFINEDPIGQVTQFKDLGVLVSSSLRFEEHIASTVAKANRILGLIKKTFLSRDTTTLVTLYKSLCTSHP